MLWNAFILAFRSIRRNILRSALTTLGIIIGVASVITMVSLGRGATAQVEQQIQNLGTNLLTVRSGQRFGFGQRSTAKSFTIDDVETIGRDLINVRTVAPTSNQGMTVVAGNSNWSTSISGTDNRLLEIKNWALSAGREFSETELKSGKAVCIIGTTIQRELFAGLDPIGNNIRIKKFSCEVIGVLASKGSSAGGADQDDTILIPIRTFWRRIAGNQDVNSIQVSVREGIATARVKKEIEQLMRERRRIAANEDDDFFVMDMQEFSKALTSTTQILTSLLGAVAAVSLLVGGIGIMNIMLVSVTERTREIGIRLAIGALERDVLWQFLVESVVLSSLGGLLGILLAIGASSALASAMQLPLIFDPTIMVIAFLFSAAVGVVFGFFPARKAARLDPIEALRYE